jgi:gas vesicle protein
MVMAKLGAFLGGLFMGGLAGAALGILVAPKRGAELRDELVEVSENIYRKAAYEIEELAEKVEELKAKVEVQDFTPAKEAIANVQTAIEDAQATQAQSQQMLSENAS